MKYCRALQRAGKATAARSSTPTASSFSCVHAARTRTCKGRPSMIIVCRGGSKAAGDTPRLLRIFTSSRAAACAASGMFSVPGMRACTSASRVYALAAAVHLAGVAAAADGDSRACRCRSAVAAIHAGGGCRGGRGGPVGGRGGLSAMTRQQPCCCSSERVCHCAASQSTQHDTGACTTPAQAPGVRCKHSAQSLRRNRIASGATKHAATMHASPVPCMTGERLG